MNFPGGWVIIEVFQMEQKIMKVGGREYPIAGYVTTKQQGTLPLVDIPMMSDYTPVFPATRR